MRPVWCFSPSPPAGGGGGIRNDQALLQEQKLKIAYAEALAALNTLEDDPGDATDAEKAAVDAALEKLWAAIAAAVDVSDETKAMYLATTIASRLAAARAVLQEQNLKTAYDAALATLNTLKDDLDDATNAEKAAVDTALAKLRAAITAAVDVPDETKAMYPAATIASELATAWENVMDARRRAANAAAMRARAARQEQAIRAAYDEALATLNTLKDDLDDATEAEKAAVDAALAKLRAAIAAAVDVSDETKAMYPATTIASELDDVWQLAALWQSVTGTPALDKASAITLTGAQAVRDTVESRTARAKSALSNFPPPASGGQLVSAVYGKNIDNGSALVAPPSCTGEICKWDAPNLPRPIEIYFGVEDAEELDNASMLWGATPSVLTKHGITTQEFRTSGENWEESIPLRIYGAFMEHSFFALRIEGRRFFARAC